MFIGGQARVAVSAAAAARLACPACGDIVIRASCAAWEDAATGRDHTLPPGRIAAAITDPAAARRGEPGTWKR